MLFNSTSLYVNVDGTTIQITGNKLQVIGSPTFTGALAGDVTGTQGATVLSATSNGTLTSLSALTSAPALATVGTIATGVWHGTAIDIAHGGTGQTTQQTALNALAGATTSGLFLRGNGTNVLLAAIQAGDVPTLNQNTTGTAANITATSNSTLTSLPSLTLPTTQLSGILAATQFPALTGDVTTTAGALATTISVGAVTDAKASLAVKPAVTVVATANQTLTGTPTIDGIATAAGSIILLTAQSTTSQNGPWVAAAGAWARPTWYPTAGTTQAFQFITTLVRLGTVYGGSVWRQTAAAPITIDTTATTWVVTPLSVNANTLSGAVPITNGGTGQITQQAALNALAATVTSGQFLRGNGTNVLMSAISAGDVPTLNQNTTGTAANITATSNSTLTSLPSLVLPTTQLSGTISLTTQVSGVLPIANGGTGAATVNANLTFVGPASGGAAAPSFRALVIADLPVENGQSFITSGTTYTTPSNINANTVFKFTLIGGGGGGGGINTNNANGSGGGGAGGLIIYVTGLTASTAYTIAIGAAGAGGISTGTAATAGTATTLTIGATTYTANGGGAGTDTNSANGGAGGTATNGTINITGKNGGPSANNAASSGGDGGGAPFGFGLGGAAIIVAGNGNPATGFGGGGSAGRGTTANGGAGAAGCILVEWHV